MDAHHKLVPIRVERFEFSKGAPKVFTETRHLFFNNLAYRKLVAELKERGLALPGAGGEKPEALATDPAAQAQMIEQVSVYVWAGLLTEARARGEYLAVEDVETWSFDEEPEVLAKKLQQAIEAYAGTSENGQATELEAVDLSVPGGAVGN